MFLLNLGYRWTLHTEIESPHGVIILPQGNSRARLDRGRTAEAPWMLLDPQLYLAGVDAASCSKVCTRLAGFPWFGVEVPPFDSNAYKVAEWEREIRETIGRTWLRAPPEDISTACTSAIDFQQGLNCTHVILPTPLIAEREDEAGVLGDWLDAALRIAEEVEVAQPLLASVAVSDAVLNDLNFSQTIETIVDVVTSRGGLDGVYIVVALTGKPVHPFKTPPLAQRAYVELTSSFARRYKIVITNFADVLGLACLGAGASAVGGGQSQGLRRLALQSLDDEGGGRAFPHFYSNSVVGEFLTESDLDPIVAAKAMEAIEDRTTFSSDLMDELLAGGSASNVPDWAESQNNLGSAQRHFLQSLATEARRFGALPPRARRSAVRGWLTDARTAARRLQEQVGPEPGKLAPVNDWLGLIKP